MYHLFKSIKFHSVNMTQTIKIVLSFLQNSDKSHYICATSDGKLMIFEKIEFEKLFELNKV